MEDKRRLEWIRQRQYMFALNITFLVGNQNIATDYQVNALPYACVIDLEGRIRYEHTGLRSDFGELVREQVDWLLAGH